jgi:hypothetical protein
MLEREVAKGFFAYRAFRAPMRFIECGARRAAISSFDIKSRRDRIGSGSTQNICRGWRIFPECKCFLQ